MFIRNACDRLLFLNQNSYLFLKIIDRIVLAFLLSGVSFPPKIQIAFTWMVFQNLKICLFTQIFGEGDWSHLLGIAGLLWLLSGLCHVLLFLLLYYFIPLVLLTVNQPEPLGVRWFKNKFKNTTHGITSLTSIRFSESPPHLGPLVNLLLFQLVSINYIHISSIL